MPLRADHVTQFLLAAPRTQMLAAVVEAGVFECLHEHGPASVSSIASALNLDKGTLHVCFSNLAFMELISAHADKKTGIEIASLTKVSKAHLLKSSGINMVPSLQIMLSPHASTVAALNAAERLGQVISQKVMHAPQAPNMNSGRSLQRCRTTWQWRVHRT
jgi:hypothetical protein